MTLLVITAPTRNKFRAIPDDPAIYRFYDAQERLLYVGKTCHAATRLRQHYAKLEISEAVKILLDHYQPHSFDPTNLDRGGRSQIYNLCTVILRSQQIDMALYLIQRIVIEYLEDVDWTNIEERLLHAEEELIISLRPPYNSETPSKDYYFLQRVAYELISRMQIVQKEVS